MFDYIFKPHSIALIGASRDSNSLGHDVLENVKKLGFTGRIYPVNLKAKKILGLKCYRSVLEIPYKVDLAIIMVPAKYVSAVIKECGKKAIRGAVVISAGFKESGTDGIRREKELQITARKYNIKIIGPNCLGIINPHVNLNASFADGMPTKGHVGLISQSGAMAVAILDWAYQSQIGFSKIISIGNKAGLTEIDLLRYLGSDPDTKVIMMYLESISDGRTFMKLCDRITNNKPVIVLKAGTSLAGQQAISSHTGSLAGSENIISAALAQCGVIRAKNVEDFFDYAKGFSQISLPKNNRVAIITNAGGPGVMATDALTSTNLQLANLSSYTKRILLRNLPKAASIHNPIDIIGDADADRYKLALTAVLKDPQVGAVVVILTPQTMTQTEATADLIAVLKKQFNKPILPVFMGGKAVAAGRSLMQKRNIPNFDYCDRAINTLHQMYLAKRIKKEVVLPEYHSQNKKLPYDIKKIQLRTREAEELLTKYQIPHLRCRLIKLKKDINKITAWPIAMKIASRDIVHKKQNKAVVVSINTPTQAEEAYSAIINNVKKNNPRAEIEGILAQPMARSQKCREIIIGMKRDNNFGPIIMFGFGGSYVEIFKDVAFRVAPLDRKIAYDQIRQIKAFPLIAKYDLNFLVDILIKVSRLILDYPQIRELDLNPILVYKRGGYVIDARIML